jgi:hypothetical protein
MKGISINISVYANQLRGEIGSDLTTLQIVLGTIANGTYLSNSYSLRQGMLISQIPQPPQDFLEKREINKCFKSIIASLQDYMDKLIALIRLTNEPIVPPLGASQKDIDNLLQEKFKSIVMKVSTEVSLNIPKKLDLVLETTANNEIKTALKSYFDLRNGLEHHKGIAKRNHLVKYKRIGLASTTGKEAFSGIPLGPGEGLVIKTFDETITFDEGGSLTISREQLDGITLGIITFAIPALETEVINKINL